ncbi:MAG: hypothetical protein AABW83_02310, partial [Nanoarchaeota archaeon]
EDNKYKIDLLKNLEDEKKRKISEAIKKNSVVIMDKLKKEFDERLKLEIRKKKAEFEKKKSELTLEVQKKVKNLFN